MIKTWLDFDVTSYVRTWRIGNARLAMIGRLHLWWTRNRGPALHVIFDRRGPSVRVGIGRRMVRVQWVHRGDCECDFCLPL